MDDADKAQDRIDNAVIDAINEVRRKPSLVPCGRCYYCDDPVPPHHLFCCGDCSIDHAHEQKMKRIQGK